MDRPRVSTPAFPAVAVYAKLRCGATIPIFLRPSVACDIVRAFAAALGGGRNPLCRNWIVSRVLGGSDPVLVLSEMESVRRSGGTGKETATTGGEGRNTSIRPVPVF